MTMHALRFLRRFRGLCAIVDKQHFSVNWLCASRRVSPMAQGSPVTAFSEMSGDCRRHGYGRVPQLYFLYVSTSFLWWQAVAGMKGSNRAPRCASIRGARGDPERARGTSTTPPSAARAARRAHAGVSLQASMAAPEALHRSGPASRLGITRWSHTSGDTPQALHRSS